MQMYIEGVVCFFVNKVTPSLMTQESILGYLCPPNGVQKLSAPCAPKWGTNGSQNGAQRRVRSGVQNGVQR